MGWTETFSSLRTECVVARNDRRKAGKSVIGGVISVFS